MCGKFRQLLAINAHKMVPRPHQRLQDRTWDAPTKGLAWYIMSDEHLKVPPPSLTVEYRSSSLIKNSAPLGPYSSYT